MRGGTGGAFRVTQDIVRRRHVYFLSGFDPKGASYYHRLYREEAARQGAITGDRYEVGPRERCATGNSVWHVHAQVQGRTTETIFEYVQWDDIVRAHWPRTAWQVFLGSVRGYRAAIASPAALWQVWQVSRRTLVALFFPMAFWLLVPLLGVAFGLGFGFVVARAAPMAAAWAAGGLGILATWWAALAIEGRLNTGWLLRIYRFASDWRADRVADLQPRLERLAGDVARRLAEGEVDEVLLVGYSVGSMLAASAAAKLQQMAIGKGIPLERLSLLTLGNCIPLLGLMTGADAFRAELKRLGQSPQVRWLDFSSLTDWGSFALVDPLSLCLGPAGPERPYSPRMASPRFHLMFEPTVYQRILRNKRRIHLQYLMAGQRPATYDYFAITAGPQCLAKRIANLPAP
jgi:hypothetical protein